MKTNIINNLKNIATKTLLHIPGAVAGVATTTVVGKVVIDHTEIGSPAQGAGCIGAIVTGQKVGSYVDCKVNGMYWDRVINRLEAAEAAEEYDGFDPDVVQEMVEEVASELPQTEEIADGTFDEKKAAKFSDELTGKLKDLANSLKPKAPQPLAITDFNLADMTDEVKDQVYNMVKLANAELEKGNVKSYKLIAAAATAIATSAPAENPVPEEVQEETVKEEDESSEQSETSEKASEDTEEKPAEPKEETSEDKPEEEIKTDTPDETASEDKDEPKEEVKGKGRTRK